MSKKIFLEKAEFILRSFGAVMLTYLEIVLFQVTGLASYFIVQGYSVQATQVQLTDAIRLQFWFNAFTLGSLYHVFMFVIRWVDRKTSTVEISHETAH